MKYLILTIFFIFLILNSCKKEIPGELVLGDLEIVPQGEVSFKGTYILNYSDDTEIIDAGIICSVDKSSGFYGPKFRTATSTSKGKHTILVSVKSPETLFYVQTFVVTKQDTILGGVKTFQSGKLYVPGSGVTDIDGNHYSTVIIGNNEWMSENLKVKKFNNGDSIPFHNYENSDAGNTPVYTFQEMDPALFDLYGAFYNTNVVLDNRNVCPQNWHIATESDFVALRDYVGVHQFNSNLKSVGNLSENTGLWKYPNAFATDIAGLNILPSGEIGWGDSFGIHESALIAMISSDDIYRFNLNYGIKNYNIYNFAGNSSYSCIRCVKD